LLLKIKEQNQHEKISQLEQIIKERNENIERITVELKKKKNQLT
jgi:hypothetical protein